MVVQLGKLSVLARIPAKAQMVVASEVFDTFSTFSSASTHNSTIFWFGKFKICPPVIVFCVSLIPRDLFLFRPQNLPHILAKEHNTS